MAPNTKTLPTAYALVIFLFAPLANAGLINGGFELPVIGSTASTQANPGLVPGWQTTDTSIEIWSQSFQGVTSFEGDQHAEINAIIDGTLFQDVTGIAPGSILGFEFAHRARVGTDVMQLDITDLGSDNLPGGGNDTVLFSKQYSATTTAWIFNTNAGEAPIVALGNTTRFAYSAISTGSGNIGAGNFLDAVDFGVGIGTVPIPSTAILILTGLLGLRKASDRRGI